MAEDNTLHIGRIVGAFGIKGWLKVYAFTEDRESILDYSPWLLCKGKERKTVEVINGQLQGNSVIAQIRGINDRNQAESLIGWQIFISADQLPPPEEGEYYWSDLIGLQVSNTEGLLLGAVTGLMETGANDVLLVADKERERAIPFLQGHTIKHIDLLAKTMLVDWDAEF